MEELTTIITKNIELSIKNFCDKLSEKYNINSKELYNIWNINNTRINNHDVDDNNNRNADDNNGNTNENNCNANDKKNDTINYNDKNYLESLTKNELIKICKEFKIKTTGKKDDLIDRIINTNKSSEISTKTVKKANNQKSKIEPKLKTEILQIKKNKFGNYEHQETHLIFNEVNKVVIGKQGEKGNIKPLNTEDIELCKKYKFQYNIPNNLEYTSLKNDIDLDDEDDELDDEDLEDINDDLEDLDDEDLDDFYEDD